MLVIKYCKDGEAVSDFKAKDFVHNYITEHQEQIMSCRVHFIYISTEMVLDEFISIAMSDNIIGKYLVFQFEEIPWEFDKQFGLDYLHPTIKEHFHLSNRLKAISVYNHYLKDN